MLKDCIFGGLNVAQILLCSCLRKKMAITKPKSIFEIGLVFNRTVVKIIFERRNVMRKLLFLVFFLMMPVSVWAWTTINHMDSPTTSDGWYTWSGHPNCTPSITSNQSAPNSLGKSFQIMCTPGLPDSSTVGGMSFNFPSSTQELWLQYYFKYSSNYDFHGVGDKHIYMWTAGGERLLSITYGNIWGEHRIWYQAGVSNAAPDSWYNPNAGNSAYYTLNEWHKVVVYQKLVSPENDIVKVWLDDKIIMDYNNATIDSDASARAAGWGKVGIDPVWGGQANPPVPKAVTDYSWWDYVIVSTEPIDGLSGGGGGQNYTKIPGAPSSLTIQ
jgi:hypothetical protein